MEMDSNQESYLRREVIENLDERELAMWRARRIGFRQSDQKVQRP